MSVRAISALKQWSLQLFENLFSTSTSKHFTSRNKIPRHSYTSSWYNSNISEPHSLSWKHSTWINVIFFFLLWTTQAIYTPCYTLHIWWNVHFLDVCSFWWKCFRESKRRIKPSMETTSSTTTQIYCLRCI